MQAIRLWLGALLLAGVAAPLAHAQAVTCLSASPVMHCPYLPAPDACGPGFYSSCPNGTLYGPNYYLQPPWCPYTPPISAIQQGGGPLGNQGGLGQGAGPPGQAAFPTHPFARSPRDFFMVYD
jgi:hypothetical protein